MADFCGCRPGHVIEVADGEQAYVQAETKGAPTRARLPREQRPVRWKNKFPNMRKLARRLLKALYGDPDVGTYCEEHCD